MPRTLLQEVEAFDASLPLARARTIPGRWYCDPRIDAAERRAIFGETWQLAARSDQLQMPGSFVTADIGGEPLVVVRDARGVLRAFFNVCRHRAACVVTEPEGRAQRLRCRYHGWTYDLSGRLLGAPEFDGVEGFKREDNGLQAIVVDTWGPLVFVNLAFQARPLGVALAPLTQRIGSLGAYHFTERRSYELACNWKVFVDNYLDGGYHVNTVHPSLAGVLDYGSYRTECFDSSSLQTSPLRSPDAKHHNTSAAVVRRGDLASYGWAFPNFMVNVYADAMDTNVVLPLSVDRCRVIIDFYISQRDSPTARKFAAESADVGHRIQLEDVGVCEDVQRGLGSRSYASGRYSVRREIAVHHFHQLVAAALRASLRPSATTRGQRAAASRRNASTPLRPRPLKNSRKGSG